MDGGGCWGGRICRGEREEEGIRGRRGEEIVKGREELKFIAKDRLVMIDWKSVVENQSRNERW